MAKIYNGTVSIIKNLKGQITVQQDVDGNEGDEEQRPWPQGRPGGIAGGQQMIDGIDTVDCGRDAGDDHGGIPSYGQELDKMDNNMGEEAQQHSAPDGVPAVFHRQESYHGENHEFLGHSQGE